jgi:hypothetical protein
MMARAFARLGNLLGRHDVPANPPQIEMKKLKKFDRGSLGKSDAKQFVKDINRLVEDYNKSNDDVERQRLLKSMQEKMQRIDYKYPSSYLAASPKYFKRRANLFKQIKNQYESMGGHSMLDPKDKPSKLSELIANMAPDKADKLTGILIKGESANLANELKDLYRTSDASHEAEQYRKFLNEHEISFLGGGNSKNFKVVNRDTGAVEVLKVDYRLDMPRNVEQHLRENMSDKFAPTHAERTVVCYDPEEQGDDSRTLLVTDFCPSGSILDYKKQFKGSNDELAEKATDIFSQMASVFSEIQQNECFFPDAKLTNWLLDDGKLVLADTKSFAFTKNGVYSSSVKGNEYVGILSTQGFQPKEYYEDKMDADKAHAFLLGKNLYCFMTGDDPYEEIFYYSSNAFKGEKGRAIKALIQNLVKDEPFQRMSIAKARQELFFIENPDVRPLFDELESLKRSNTDAKMIEFIEENKNQLVSAKKPECKQIVMELKQLALQLKDGANVLDDLQKLSVGDNDIKMTKFRIDNARDIEKANPQQRVKIQTQLKQLVGELQEGQKVLEKLNALKFGENDEEMNSFIKQQKDKITKAKPEDRVAIEKELMQSLDALTKENGVFEKLENLKISPDDKVMNKFINEKKREFIVNKDDRDNIVLELSQLANQLKDSKDVFSRLNTEGLDENDDKMKQYIIDEKKRLTDAKPEDRVEIIRELNNVADKLHSNKQFNKLKTITKNLRDNSHWYTMGKAKKATNIERAMKEVSIEDRANFDTKKSDGKQKVMQELARHRHLGKRDKVYLDTNHKIDNKKAAQTYKDFKKQFDSTTKGESTSEVRRTFRNE